MKEIKEIDNYAKHIHGVLIKIEDILHLMKDAKYIIANDKILGIRQNLNIIYNKMIKENDKLNENNNN